MKPRVSASSPVSSLLANSSTCRPPTPAAWARELRATNTNYHFGRGVETGGWRGDSGREALRKTSQLAAWRTHGTAFVRAVRAVCDGASDGHAQKTTQRQPPAQRQDQRHVGCGCPAVARAALKRLAALGNSHPRDVLPVLHGARPGERQQLARRRAAGPRYEPHARQRQLLARTRFSSWRGPADCS